MRVPYDAACPSRLRSVLGGSVSDVHAAPAALLQLAQPPPCPPPSPQVHPGGLIDEEGGKRQLIIDVDDKLITEGVAIGPPCLPTGLSPFWRCQT